MSNRQHIRSRHPSNCRGVALLTMLFVVALAFCAVLITKLAKHNPEIERQKKTIEALAQAKQALIAWSLLQGDLWPATKMVEENGIEQPTFTYYRPGTLPCPDTYSLADSKSGNATGSCSASKGTSIGRLPWKSLGEQKLYDGYSELLWYAVSDNFRNTSPNSAAINSDTKGSLLLYANDGTTLLTPPGEELAAIIFAPGPPLPEQDRTESSQNIASNYLDAFNGKNNANAAGPFIKGPIKNSSGELITNDIVVGITARELIGAIEKRALTEAQNALSKMAVLPNPAPRDGLNCAALITDVKSVSKCSSDNATCSGRLPEDALEPYAAKWFLQNGWGRVMIYAIHNDAGCTTPLKVDGNQKNYVLIAPGTARQGQNRPSTSLSNYLEDSGNADGWSGNLDFFNPDLSSNDQLRANP